MTKKLIAIDLDGTTLNQDSLISNKTLDVLKSATQQGHYVTIATGRPYRMSSNFYKQLQLTTPMVNFNGGLVHLPEKQWSGETQSLIHRDIVFDIIAQKNQLQLDFIAAENRDTFYIDDLSFFDYQFFAAEPSEKNILTASNMQTNPTSLLLRTQPNQAEMVTENLERQFGKEIDIRTWGGPSPILEVVAKGIQKATGVAHIADYLNVKQDDVIAFGDENNDLEMLAYAGWGVAMKNGTPQAKAAANDITNFTNAEDGLAQYLTDYLSL